MKTCCTHDCRQGRDCPLTTPEDTTESALVFWAAVAMVVVVASIVIADTLGVHLSLPF